MRICRAISRAASSLKLPLAWFSAACVLALAGCGPRKLPQANTYAAQLYAERCGQCHRLYDPRSMTAAMWQVQVKAMQDRMRTAGITPLSPRQRKLILGYLERNAGTD
jgi:hypothetical protein